MIWGEVGLDERWLFVDGGVALPPARLADVSEDGRVVELVLDGEGQPIGDGDVLGLLFPSAEVAGEHDLGLSG